MLSFKWHHFKQDMILMLVRWYLAYPLSYRDVEELALERDLKVDHSTINRWVIRKCNINSDLLYNNSIDYCSFPNFVPIIGAYCRSQL